MSPDNSEADRLPGDTRSIPHPASGPNMADLTADQMRTIWSQRRQLSPNASRLLDYAYECEMTEAEWEAALWGFHKGRIYEATLP